MPVRQTLAPESTNHSMWSVAEASVRTLKENCGADSYEVSRSDFTGAAAIQLRAMCPGCWHR